MTTSAVEFEKYRPVLTGHCYRMLGSVVDAEDAVQEAMLRAVRNVGSFKGESALGTWLRGHDSIGRWLLGHGIGCKGSVLVPVRACGGMPAFAQYRRGGEHAWALIIPELDAHQVASMTCFLDVETLFPRFGLPLKLDSQVRPQ